MKTFTELVRRFTDVQGVPFYELAPACGLELPADPTRARGFAGGLVQVVAGLAQADSRQEPDLGQFDIEMKTIPVGLDLVPREPTSVTMIDYQSLPNESWFESHAYRKLRVVLFVPIVKADKNDPSAWYIRRPFVWMPSRQQLDQLQTDWDGIKRVVAAGAADTLSSASPTQAGQGTFLMAKTHGQGGDRDLQAYSVGGKSYTAKKRGFYLRASFVELLLDENVRYRPGPS